MKKENKLIDNLDENIKTSILNNKDQIKYFSLSGNSYSKDFC